MWYALYCYTRTGALIAIDWAQHMFKATGETDVIAIIKALRQSRVAMVQTSSQYNFVHKAVLQLGKLNKKEIRTQGIQASAP